MDTGFSANVSDHLLMAIRDLADKQETGDVDPETILKEARNNALEDVRGNLSTEAARADEGLSNSWTAKTIEYLDDQFPGLKDQVQMMDAETQAEAQRRKAEFNPREESDIVETKGIKRLY